MCSDDTTATTTTTTTASPLPSLTSYKVLSFDIFGTLLDWESGLYPYLEPIISQLPTDHPCAAPFHPSIPPSTATTSSTTTTSASSITTTTATHSASPSSPPGPRHPIFLAWDAHEHRLEAELPHAPHEDILSFTIRDLSTQLGTPLTPSQISAASSSSIRHWPAFADTLSAMTRLGRHYKLVALSNVSEAAIASVLANGLKGVRFDAVYTAERIGSYKPAMENFEYLLAKVREAGWVTTGGEGGAAGREGGGKEGGEGEEVLHVAHGVVTDQLPADGCGIDHVWVERGVDNWGAVDREGLRRYRGGVADLGVLADMVDRAFAEKE